MLDSLHKKHTQRIPEEDTLVDLFFPNISITFVVQTN
nr:MAG TPA: hypothetical protein [Caudoviricetes sp.]